MAQHKGFDASHYQGDIDFEAARAGGFEFVVLKATEGSEAGTAYVDPKFVENVNAAHDAGFQVWAYHYFLGVSENDAKAEADWFDKNAEPVKDKLAGVFCDVEDKSLNTNKDVLTGFVNAFTEEVKAKGYKEVGVYSGKFFYDSHLDASKLDSDDIDWLAHYGVSDLGETADVWQYTSTGSVPGVQGHVDLDISYNDKVGIVAKPKPVQPKPVPAQKKDVPNTYKVESGDSLSKIAAEFGVDQAEIVKLNHISNPNLIQVGQVLKMKEVVETNKQYIPANKLPKQIRTYVIKKGDTLSEIAQHFNVTVEQIKEVNGLGSDIIYPGRTLKIDKPNGGQLKYTVKSGDNLWTIAKDHGVTVNQIEYFNNLHSDVIQPGQVLRIR